MLVKENFCDHWKLKKLKRLSGRDDSAEMVLRLWGNCQQRKTDRFENPNPDQIAAICNHDGDPGQLVSWLIECAFLDQEGDTLIVHDWAEHNGTLIASWENGKKGGRSSSSRKTRGLTAGITDGFTDREIEGKKDRKTERVEEDGASTAAISGDLSDEDWIKSLKEDPDYQRIDIEAVIRKCQQYCKENGKDFIRSRLIRWLEREEKPIQVATPEKPKKRKSEEPPPDQWKEVQQKIYPDSTVFDSFWELPTDIRQEIRDYVEQNTFKSDQAT